MTLQTQNPQKEKEKRRTIPFPVLIFFVVAVTAFGMYKACSSETIIRIEEEKNKLKSNLIDARNELYKIKVQLDSAVQVLRKEGDADKAMFMLAKVSKDLDDLNEKIEKGDFTKQKVHDANLKLNYYRENRTKIKDLVYKQQNDDLKNAQATIRELNNIIRMKDAEIRELNREKNELKEQLGKAKGENEINAIRIRELMNGLASANSDRDKLKAQESIDRTRIAEIENLLKRKDFASMEEKRRLEKELDNLRGTLDLTKEELGKVQKEKETAVQELDGYIKKMLEQGDFVCLYSVSPNTKRAHEGVMNDKNKQQTPRNVRYIEVRYLNALGMSNTNKFIVKLYRFGSSIEVASADLTPDVGTNSLKATLDFSTQRLSKGKYEMRLLANDTPTGRTQIFTIF